MTIFVSLGIQCNVAEELRKRGLRKYSLPYDWLYIGNYCDILTLLNSRNEVLFKKENWYKNPLDNNQFKNNKLINSGSRHFFNSELSNFDEVTKLFRKRTERLFELFSGEEKIEFIRDQQWYDIDCMKFSSFLDQFQEYFGINYPDLSWTLKIFVDSVNEKKITSMIKKYPKMKILFVDSNMSKDWKRPMNPWNSVLKD